MEIIFLLNKAGARINYPYDQVPVKSLPGKPGIWAMLGFVNKYSQIVKEEETRTLDEIKAGGSTERYESDIPRPAPTKD